VLAHHADSSKSGLERDSIGRVRSRRNRCRCRSGKLYNLLTTGNPSNGSLSKINSGSDFASDFALLNLHFIGVDQMKRVQRAGVTSAIHGMILGTVLMVAGPVYANPIINVLFDPTVAFSAADKAEIQNAINFYTTNITSNFTATIAFGAQTGGGVSTFSSSDTVTYNNYYNALVANSSGNATDISAIASLGGGPHTNNPVTGSPNVVMSTTLAALLGLGTQTSSSFSQCGGLTANACIQISTGVLNIGGTPLAGLFGNTQHAVDEVLGTMSALPNGGGSLPSDPNAADLFRYTAPGVRSFALNTSTDVPCTGTPTAYLSIDAGVTDLNPYNNCNNGGDYGDWNFVDGLQVQDAFGPGTAASSLDLTSPEVRLLDAVGYNFVSATTSVPEPASISLLGAGLAAMIPVFRKRRRRRGNVGLSAFIASPILVKIGRHSSIAATRK
jgi:hypothetical protein